MLEIIYEKLSARLGSGRWMILTKLESYRWQVQLWGTETMQVEFAGLTVQEAQEYSTALVSLFLLNNHPEVPIPPPTVEWKPVVTRIQQRYKFQSA